MSHVLRPNRLFAEQPLQCTICIMRYFSGAFLSKELATRTLLIATVTVFFFLMSWFYVGNSITNCSTSTIAFNSDSTGGHAWAQWASGNRLNWSYSNISNYPSGEPINRPQDVTSVVFNVPYRVVSSITTPICGLNIMLVIGFLSNALVMFGLILWLFKNKWIALFAGFAAAFSPYHLFKAQSHVPYVYSSLFIGIIWLYLWFRQKPSIKRVIPLAIVIASTYYFNGYYILLSSILIGGLVGGDFFLDVFHLSKIRKNKRKTIQKLLKERYRYVVALGFMLVVLLIPIFYVQLQHGANINKTLALARGDINHEAIIYSARAEEYILPSFNNPLVPDSYKQWRLSLYHGSNPTENTLYIGITILILSTIGLFGLWIKKIRNLEVVRSLYMKDLLIILIIVATIGMILSLPPVFTLFGKTLPLPSKFIIQITESWRVFARFYLIIQPIFVILAASGLFVISRNLRGRKFIMLCICFLALLFVEFLPSPRAVSGDLHQHTPTLYHMIKNDPEVKRLAEYPIMDFAYAPSLFTYQQVHGKELYNAWTPSFDQEDLDKAIGGVNDPQTLGVLRALGVDLITSRGVALTNSKLIPYYNKNGLFAYRLTNIEPREAVLLAKEGFDYYSIDEKQFSHRILKNRGTLTVQHLGNTTVERPYAISFRAIPLEEDSTIITVYQDGKKVFEKQLTINDPEVEFTISSPKNLKIDTLSALDISNMDIK